MILSSSGLARVVDHSLCCLVSLRAPQLQPYVSASYLALSPRYVDLHSGSQHIIPGRITVQPCQAAPRGPGSPNGRICMQRRYGLFHLCLPAPNCI